MDYKELIDELRMVSSWECSDCYDCNQCVKAATAIETLLEERDAAVEDLKKFADAGEACHLCKHLPCHPKNDHCIGWEWRGPEKGDEQ